MNYKKWKGLTCALLASLMMSSAFAAPVRNEKPSPSMAAPKATEAPKAVKTPKASETPKASSMPNAKPSEVQSKPSTVPCPAKKEEAPKATITAPKKQEAPKAVEQPKVTTVPKQTETPKKSEAPKKEEAPCKKVCPNKPFALDHFKMIVNTLKKLGVEEQEIVTYIKEGKKLEEILTAEKINPKKFKKCIIKEYFKEVDEAQKNGQITVEQSKQLKGAIKETIKNWLPKK